MNAGDDTKWVVYNKLDYDDKELKILTDFFDNVTEHITNISSLTKQKSSSALNEIEFDDNNDDSNISLPRYNSLNNIIVNKNNNNNADNNIVLNRRNTNEMRSLKRRSSVTLTNTKYI